MGLYFCDLCAFLWLNFLWLTETEFAGAALFAFEAAADFQESVEHLGTLGAARGELRVCLFVHVLETMKFVGDVECGEDRHFQRLDGECAGRDLRSEEHTSELQSRFGIS